MKNVISGIAAVVMEMLLWFVGSNYLITYILDEADRRNENHLVASLVSYAIMILIIIVYSKINKRLVEELDSNIASVDHSSRSLKSTNKDISEQYKQADDLWEDNKTYWEE